MRRVSQEPEIPKSVIDAAKPVIQTAYSSTSNGVKYLPSLKSVTNFDFSKRMKTKILRFAKKNAFCISKPKCESMPIINSENQGILNEAKLKPLDYLKPPSMSEFAL